MSTNHNDTDKNISYGYDKGSPDGDESALSIKSEDGMVHTFVGSDADVIMKLIKADRDIAIREAKIGLARKVLAVSSDIAKRPGVTQTMRLALITKYMKEIIPSTIPDLTAHNHIKEEG